MGAVEALQFNLNPVARNLRASKSNMIGILIPDLYGTFFSELIRSIEYELEDKGFQFFLFHTDRNAKREAEYVRRLVGYKVDGLIVAVTDPEENLSLYEWVQEEQIPVVFVDRVPPVGVSGSSVTTNNFGSATYAVQHLFESYSEVAMITPYATESPIKERQDAYYKVCQSLGKAPIVYSTDGWGSEVGYEQMRELLASTPSPIGVFCVTNSVARGAFQKLREQDINVPGTVGIVAFDDASWTTLVTPEVTVVRSKPFDIGVLAVRRLMECMDGSDQFVSQHDLVDADLIVRNSSVTQKGITE